MAHVLTSGIQNHSIGNEFGIRYSIHERYNNSGKFEYCELELHSMLGHEFCLHFGPQYFREFIHETSLCFQFSTMSELYVAIDKIELLAMFFEDDIINVVLPNHWEVSVIDAEQTISGKTNSIIQLEGNWND